ncbi:unnamed protein product, partial [Gongylonema pulchrum]|uniref:Uncharacterized protein n=1 Tax=Gongylonema pulchrum TaxID=637853 RepID=A0A183D285_9BILA
MFGIVRLSERCIFEHDRAQQRKNCKLQASYEEKSVMLSFVLHFILVHDVLDEKKLSLNWRLISNFEKSKA